MANTNSPFGFVQVSDRADARLEEFTLASTYATKLGRGDPVELGGSGTDIVRSAAASTALIGIFWGVSYFDADGDPKWSTYWPGNVGYTGAKVQVLPITPDGTFRVQGDSVAAGDIGALADFTVADASATLKRSQTVLAVNGATATSGKNFLIKKLADIPGNAYGAYAVVDGVFVEGAYATATGV